MRTKKPCRYGRTLNGHLTGPRKRPGKTRHQMALGGGAWLIRSPHLDQTVLRNMKDLGRGDRHRFLNDGVSLQKICRILFALLHCVISRRLLSLGSPAKRTEDVRVGARIHIGRPPHGDGAVLQRLPLHNNIVVYTGDLWRIGRPQELPCRGCECPQNGLFDV